MAPKKDKAATNGDKSGTFNEVEKTFLDLQLAECNRKIARLRTALEEYEIRNEDLQKAYNQLDEDRADIIAYLKKVLAAKTEENSELKEKVRGLEEIREIENSQFHATVAQLEKNFAVMKDQLTSENKLLAGKLNTLEEFRAIRDDLMRKFEKQEKDFEDQETMYKRKLYETEKKFVIGKDKLKKEMEARLLQLAQDFQDATQLRVAASTQRVIRENIALSNELENILSNQEKIGKLNEKYKEDITAARISKELAEEERDKAISKSIIQVKVIKQLTLAVEQKKQDLRDQERQNINCDNLQNKVQKLTKENEDLSLKVRILEQQLYAKLSDQNKALAEASSITQERDKLKQILKEASIAIQSALKLNVIENSMLPAEELDGQVLLSHLLQILTQFHDMNCSGSTDTLDSLGKIYEAGDLGFIPKSSKKTRSGSSLTIQSKDLEKSVGSILISPNTFSEASFQTIPAVGLLAASTNEVDTISIGLSPSQSLLQSTASTDTTQIEDESKEEMTKKIADSKIAIQKSLMKDLAYQTQSIMKFAKAKATKSVLIVDDQKESKEKSEISLEKDSDIELAKAKQESEILIHEEQIETGENIEETDDKEEKEAAHE